MCLTGQAWVTPRGLNQAGTVKADGVRYGLWGRVSYGSFLLKVGVQGPEKVPIHKRGRCKSFGRSADSSL